jgi:hypothetical protein
VLKLDVVSAESTELNPSKNLGKMSELVLSDLSEGEKRGCFGYRARREPQRRRKRLGSVLEGKGEEKV